MSKLNALVVFVVMMLFWVLFLNKKARSIERAFYLSDSYQTSKFTIHTDDLYFAHQDKFEAVQSNLK